MTISIIRELPKESNYIPLPEFQSATPESFTTPVLHNRQQNCTVTLTAADASRIPAFADAPKPDSEHDDLRIPGIDFWVTSENLILFNTTTATGVTLPYQSLTLHALTTVAGKTGIYMQLSLNPSVAANSNSAEFDDDEMVEVTLFTESDAAKEVFKALSDCASLHPDPDASEDEEDAVAWEGDVDAEEPRIQLEGFPEGLGGGWITAENVGEWEGRFEDVEVPVGGVVLGPGAGTVRAREEEGEEAETKWRRTEEGAGEEKADEKK